MAQDTMVNGKAFEYACLIALRDAFSARQRVCVEDSSQLQTARRCFETLDGMKRADMMLAAEAMSRVLVRLEPKLTNCRDGDILTLCLQSDERGQAGDVRDVLCMRVGDRWEIGLSCKHNHSAVKHSRLATDLDFGRKWVGCPCSAEYFNAVNPIFRTLGRLRDAARQNGGRFLWRDYPDKESKVYVPILDAFISEVKRIDEALDGNLAPRLVHYLLGENDFYKVIADDGSRSTRIEAFNLSGTLGEPFNGIKSLYGRQRLKLPTRIIELRYKDGSRNTVELTCDRGWQFSLRIHNASSEIEPSLKFDIQLVSKLSSHASVNIDEAWQMAKVCDEARPFRAGAASAPLPTHIASEFVSSVAEELKFREYLPFYSLRAACGCFGDGEPVECDGWVKVDDAGKLDEKMFVVWASGRSMEPKIHDGDLCVMRAHPVGSRQGKIVLAQHRETYDPDTGGAYSIKRYESDKVATDDGSWRHASITLRPLNPSYEPIEVVADGGDSDIVAELVKVL